jgi:hypothetical protein
MMEGGIITMVLAAPLALFSDFVAAIMMSVRAATLITARDVRDMAATVMTARSMTLISARAVTDRAVSCATRYRA